MTIFRQTVKPRAPRAAPEPAPPPPPAPTQWTGWIRLTGEPWRALCNHADRWECWRLLLDLRPGVDESTFELLVNGGGEPDKRRRPR